MTECSQAFEGQGVTNKMGFWHTGYMEFHEPTGERSGPRLPPPPPKFPCPDCGRIYRSVDDVAVHRFDGHSTVRPALTLRGRECGRSRLSVISTTAPSDWNFHNTQHVFVNSVERSPAEAITDLCAKTKGVVAVKLVGERTDQNFEFSFSIANEADLVGVDDALGELVHGRSLTINSIEGFLNRAAPFESARRYRDALANYFYGVLAREASSESGLLDERNNGSTPAYAARFDDAVAELGRFDRPPAEAICGLVAFHYNQFDLALRKTQSPRVARASRRLAALISGANSDAALDAPDTSRSLDYTLSDTTTERVLALCCVPLDGTATASINEIEALITGLQPSDETKLRIIAAEHHLATGNRDRGLSHVAALRHSSLTEEWSISYRNRLEER